MPVRPTGPSPARGSPAMGEEEPKDQQLVVVLRIRPLNEAELQEGATVIAHKTGEQVVTLLDPVEEADDTLRPHRSREKTFILDMVFDEHASQEDVYTATTQHLVEAVLAGYNATVFAYGPSGTGKTFTMLGLDTQPGIYLRALGDLFLALEAAGGQPAYHVSMSYLEIYNEVVRDLLNPASGFLELREDARGAVQVAGITEVSTSNAQEIMQLLTQGNRQRTQEPTAANRTSSRSHAVLQVSVCRRAQGPQLGEELLLGRLFLVDLAGSERASQTQNRGQRMKEGAHINRSLLALGNCITALSGRARHYVNFRDSKLTRLLKDALGGNSRTVMIAHISPASSHFEESRSTLLYAHRAKNIKTRVKRNLLSASFDVAQYSDAISHLRGETEQLKAKLEKPEPHSRPPEPQEAAEEDGGQLRRIRTRLLRAFREQLQLESGLAELHLHVCRQLLTITDWEWERTHLEHGDRDQEEGEVTELQELALAKEEVAALLAEQKKTAALKAGLERRLAQAQKKAAQLERLVRAREERREEPPEGTEPRAAAELEPRLLGLLGPGAPATHHCLLHRRLCRRLVRDQRRLIRDAGLAVPEAVERRYRLCVRELGEGPLDRLLELQPALVGSLQDDPGLSVSPPPREPGQGRRTADRKDLPWGAHLQLPLMALDAEGDSPEPPKDTDTQKRSCLLPPAPLRILLTPPSNEKPDPLSLQSLLSKLRSPGGPDPRAPWPEAGARLSPQALREMAVGTKTIGRIAASRRCQAQDREAGSRRSSLHPPEESLDSRDPSPADRRWPRGSPGRDTSLDRTARKKRSPSLPGSGPLATERLPPAAPEPPADNLPAPVLPQLPRGPGRGFLPAVPSASKAKPSLGLCAGSTDSGSRHHSPLPPSNPRPQHSGSTQPPRRPK